MPQADIVLGQSLNEALFLHRKGRLRAFIQAVEQKASAHMGPGQVGEFRARPRKDPLSTTYEECLGKLTVEERGELDRMIQKMSSVLGSPPGAVTPQ